MVSVLLVSFLFALGVYLRTRHLDSLRSLPSVFPDGDPYLWTRLARVLRHGPLPAKDALRDFPDVVRNAWPPPLVALLPAWLSRVFGFSMRTLELWLPPLLSMLFLVPLWLWLRPFAPRAVFVGAALVGGLGGGYLDRTMPGSYDTDVLVLALGFAVVALVDRAVEEKRPLLSYLAVAAAGLTLRLLQWWYPKPLFVLMFTACLVAALVLARRRWVELIALPVLFVLAAGPLALRDSFGGSAYLLHRFWRTQGPGDPLALPVSLTSSIDELARPTGRQWIQLTTGSLATLLVAALGLVALLVRRPRRMLPALPLLVAGLAAVGAGRKNVLYVVPFVGMGLGWAMSGLTSLHGRFFEQHRQTLAAASIALTAALALSPQRWRKVVQEHPFTPFLDARTAEDFKHLSAFTPPNAVLWSWWDWGYSLQALAGRTTVTDGETLDDTKIDLTALSLMVDDDTSTRNVIAFTTAFPARDYLGTPGGLPAIDRGARAFDGRLARPVYVVLTQRMFFEPYLERLGLAAAGDRDYAASALPPPTSLGCTMLAGGKLDCKGKGPEDLASKQGKDWRKVVYVDRAAGSTRVLRARPGPGEVAFLERSPTGGLQLVVANSQLAHSMLGRLWLSTAPLPHFRLVMDDFPEVVVWQVR